ncbi:MAG: SMI1/KNR4 family protein, partial [Pseudomonadota bacterium]
DKMVRIMASGYGPFYVIDCEYVDQDGESPVFLVDQLGYAVSRERVANSFGEFLLTEMKECIK